MTRFVDSTDHPSNWNRDERNLYNRVFAGFLFAGGGDEAGRASVLFECDNRLREDTELLSTLDRTPRPRGDLVLTFDNNLHDVVPELSSGPEYGDVVLWGENGFVTIEAKCHTDWNFEKDVEACLASGAEVARSTGLSHLAHVLVVAEQKWHHVQQPSATRQARSQYKKLASSLAAAPANVCVHTWEQIAKAARDRLRANAGTFPAWLEMQVKICLRTSTAMPPTHPG